MSVVLEAIIADWRTSYAIQAQELREVVAEREALRAVLERGVRVASQFMDTGRGDLDGWIAWASDVLAATPGGER